METMTFQIRSSEKYMSGFNHSNHVAKTGFECGSLILESSGTLILATFYNRIQSYFKTDLGLTMLFNVYFLYRK